MQMQAMIFAAGIGSRLKPFTNEHPKALAPVAGIPALERVIRKLKSAGVVHMVVNVHHFAEQIVDFLHDNSDFGCDIVVSDESDMLLDTGGGLLKAQALFNSNEPILLHNADIVTDFPIAEMMAWHASTGADVTLMTSNRKSSRMLYFDDLQRLRGWKNLSTEQTIPAGLNVAGLSPQAFGGVHIVNPTVLPRLAEYAAANGAKFSIVPFYLHCMNDLKIVNYTPTESFNWFDIGTPEKLKEAELKFGQLK